MISVTCGGFDDAIPGETMLNIEDTGEIPEGEPFRLLDKVTGRAGTAVVLSGMVFGCGECQWAELSVDWDDE